MHTNARVVTVHRTATGFQVLLADGTTLEAGTLIAATGSFHRPYLPLVPGQELFRGQLLHSSAYRNPDIYQGQHIVVVGGGNSAVQIAVELARVARVTLATRTVVRFTPQRILGRDIHFWTRLLGLERLPLSGRLRLQEFNPVLDTGIYRHALATGLLHHRPMFAGFSPEGVIWANGERERVDTVIFATGYRLNLDYLAGLDALDGAGRARQRAGVSLTTPGLAYVGLPAQRTFASATLRGVGPDAAYVLAHLRRYLRSRSPSPVHHPPHDPAAESVSHDR